MSILAGPGPSLVPRQPDAAESFLAWVARRLDHAETTRWGPYCCFDGYALAAFATGHVSEGFRLFKDTLDMIELNHADERAGGDVWHLADFAVHPLLRLHASYRHAGLEHQTDDPTAAAESWARFESVLGDFLWHHADLTENHNLLHAAGRLLTARLVPAAGRHLDADAARSEVLEWLDRWVAVGSQEWESATYYNVNLLSLLNLRDLSGDAEVAAAATAALDLLALEMATNRFAGALVGASRRSYACYRLDTAQNPTRPVNAIWFGDEPADLPHEPDPFAPDTLPYHTNFIGGAIVAAVSDYRPPAAVRRIARDPSPQTSQTRHATGQWFWGPFPRKHEPDHEPALGRHTWRCGDAMLSVMNSYGGRGRYTEHVWQATLGERAVVFTNQPAFVQAKQPLGLARRAWRRLIRKRWAQQVLADFEQQPKPDHDQPRWDWSPTHLPPGHDGETRPGFWQGNQWGPRSVGVGRMGLLIYRVDRDAQLPWVHAYWPDHAFDETHHQGLWHFARHDRGYVALWCSRPLASTQTGRWAGVERRAQPGDAALVVVVGSAALHGDFTRFRQDLAAAEPTYEPAARRLTCVDPDTQHVVRVDYEHGLQTPQDANPNQHPRIGTPFGRLPLGQRAFDLHHGDETCTIALP